MDAFGYAGLPQRRERLWIVGTNKYATRSAWTCEVGTFGSFGFHHLLKLMLFNVKCLFLVAIKTQLLFQQAGNDFSTIYSRALLWLMMAWILYLKQTNCWPTHLPIRLLVLLFPSGFFSIIATKESSIFLSLCHGPKKSSWATSWEGRVLMVWVRSVNEHTWIIRIIIFGQHSVEFKNRYVPP